MITGDHATTAGAIAAELGIEGRVVTGDELTAMNDDELATEIDGIGVCARVSPEHKVRVVEALKAGGHIVAMTGDGVNDAAALRKADIGVAMGITGTEVTKEAGDMVLTDDNFATIVGAVEQGRTIYDNIVKFVRFQLATNMGAIATILGAALIGLPVPFSPIQVLWVNLIADGPPAMTLGVDQPEPDVMDRTPTPSDAAILTGRRIGRLVFLGRGHGGRHPHHVRVGRRPTARTWPSTMAFTTFVLQQMVNVLNSRSRAPLGVLSLHLHQRAALGGRRLAWSAPGPRHDLGPAAGTVRHRAPHLGAVGRGRAGRHRRCSLEELRRSSAPAPRPQVPSPDPKVSSR